MNISRKKIKSVILLLISWLALYLIKLEIFRERSLQWILIFTAITAFFASKIALSVYKGETQNDRLFSIVLIVISLISLFIAAFFLLFYWTARGSFFF